jgi:glycosyltransferase involved in cell wall biosynthesis
LWKSAALDADLIHCFNLHPEYFDLRILPTLSRERPVLLDLRDAWLLSGHCAHSFDCERWKWGCGNCPDLNIYPAVPRDGTAFNWERKRGIFSKSRLYVATPSEWLMRKVRESILAPAVVESRVIPTGVDLSVFRPGERARARTKLQIPHEAKVLLFAANGIRRNMWKDYRTLSAAVRYVSERWRGQPLLFIALGETAPDELIGEARIRFIPHLKNQADVAMYQQAADVYMHAASADTFPRAVLEALACGVPVVATAVGGIPEQIVSLDVSPLTEATGIIVPPKDPIAMGNAIVTILSNDELCRRLSENAANSARNRFDVRRQAEAYIAWYRELLAKNRT